MYHDRDFGLYIEGRWSWGSGTQKKPILDPATEGVIGHIPDANSDDIEQALQSAAAGFKLWKAVQPWERSEKLRNVSQLLRQRIDELSIVMSTESGKPLAESRGEWIACAEQFEWYAEEAKRIFGQIYPGRDEATRMSVIYQPVGVVAAFSAWNFPALLPARKIAAALAAGCSVILKPAGETPGCAAAIVKACHDAGLPPGAVNMVTGNSARIAEQLIRSPIVRKVSLTGSTPVGKQLLHLCADGVKKATMELGGHAPVLIFADADIEAAAEACAKAKFRNCGQVCASPSRFYLQEAAYDRFAKRFTEVAQQLTIGRFDAPGADFGPLANARGLAHSKRIVKDALERGAKLLTGGKQPAGLDRGFFFEPTVLGHVPDDATIMIEEPFAPIAPLAVFRDFDDVVARANATPFGLTGYVFSRDLRTATMAAEALEVGMVGINEVAIASADAPFGGIKESGMGREGGSLGIKDYLEAKFIKTRLT
ncbi:succinate-semialdehyde dehydrogenase/glutarate-semialdehyde dehydrogenase [Rhodopseudomonas rhenobacensis]|uniref:Succinate-semialdehyde dehydrogenase/glutarate-semialdehyde dehydrogenase n=1 Tax=Rhodopseudomonas rhenobacensis TaxID=87461 RepID=A0A7W7Z3H6_9BRAD|nr:NAD-dependent succinate-semialdehyde dehydrogenase [Rhodopseudomonas rhenobacensis]MBB5047296.1 succinate-semialdehyde dehydrogenase/glutarate-semialdehyde dehydrogenase [Rhodopseudomonas rhenobacensis]